MEGERKKGVEGVRKKGVEGGGREWSERERK